MLNEESQKKVKRYVSFLRHQMLADGSSFESVYSMGDEAIRESFRRCCGCGDDLFSKSTELRTILEFDEPDRVLDILYENVEHGEEVDEDEDEDDDTNQFLHEALIDDDEDEDDEDLECVHAQGIMDGATTLDEAIEMVIEFADFLTELKNEGYELVTDIDDDFGFITKEKDHEQKD